MRPLPRRLRTHLLWLAGLSCAGCGSDAPAPDAETAMQQALATVALDCDDPFERFYDADGDGHGDLRMAVELCAEVDGFVAEAGDCDALRADISPDATEICDDGIDNNCSGADEACGPVELAQDGYTILAEQQTGEFGFRIAVGLDLNGNGREEVLVADPAFDNDDGRAWVLELPPAVEGGAADDLGSVLLMDVSGDRTDMAMGQGIATGWWADTTGLRDTVAVSCRGPVDEASEERDTAVFLYQNDAGGGAGRSEADAVLLGSIVDPSFGYAGVESLNMGRWLDGATDQGVLAAAYLTNSRVFVVPMDGLSGDVTLVSAGVQLATTELGIDLGTGLHWTDLDGDGLDDLVVGAPAWDPDAGGGLEDGGALWMVTGDDLAALPPGGGENLLDDVGVRAWYPAGDFGMGHTISSADLDLDGEMELVVGSFEENPVTFARTILLDPDGLRGVSPGDDFDVLTPTGGVRVLQIEGDEAHDYFGFSVAALAGPQPRVGVGSPGRDGTGAEETFGGGFWLFDMDDGLFDATAETVGTIGATWVVSDVPGDGLGTGMASAGDVDGDGEDELWISALGFTDVGRLTLLTRTGS